MTDLLAPADTSLAGKPLKAEKHGNRAPASIAFLIALWFALAFSVLCLAVLLIDSFLDGMTRLDSALFTEYTSRLSPETRPAPAPRSSARPWSSASPPSWRSPWASPPGSTWRSSPTRSGGTTSSSRSTSPTSPPSRRSSTACSPPAWPWPSTSPAGSCSRGAIALALLILPVIIIATREAMRAVPRGDPRRFARARRHPAPDRLAADAARRRPRHRDRRDPRALPRPRRGRPAAAPRRRWSSSPTTPTA